MKMQLRRLLASPLTAFVMILVTVSSASADTQDPADQFKNNVLNSPRNTGPDFSLLTEVTWFWPIVWMLGGAVVATALIFGTIGGGARISFAGDKSNRVKEGLAYARNSLLGSIMIIGGFALVGGVIALVLGIIF